LDHSPRFFFGFYFLYSIQIVRQTKRQRTNITEKNAAKESVEVVQQQETEESVDILQQSIDDYDED
jgi:hypothetical protein